MTMDVQIPLWINWSMVIHKKHNATYVDVDDPPLAILYCVRGVLLHNAVLANLVRVAGLA
jgi:hypothetical protein